MASRAELVATGLHFGEGPRWHDGRLWFSDFFAHSVKTLDAAGRVEIAVTIEDRPSGLGWLPDGRLIMAAMTSQRLVAWDGATTSTHADLSGLATFHINDLVVDDVGRAYVGYFGFPLDHEIAARGFSSVIADHPKAAVIIVEPDGTASVGAPEMSFPNGSVITPDGRTLIVGETLGCRLTAFDIAAGGSLANRRVWADLGRRPPDGICLDADGHIWVANPVARECVLVAEGGEVLDVVETDNPCFACMLGGDDRRTLYMITGPSADAEFCAANTEGHIQASRVDTPGAGRP